MKNRFKKILNIMCLALLIIFCYRNLSYAGSIGDAPEFEAIFFVIIYSPLIIFLIFLLFSTALREISLKRPNEIVRNKERNYSMPEVILYAILISIIVYLILVYRNILLTMNIIIAISIVLMIVFLYYIYIDKKQEELEQEGKTRNGNNVKLEKNITKIRNNVYLTNFLSICIGLIANIGPIIVLLLILIIISIVILTVSSKKIATVIGFISLIVSISIILHYSITV